jgi:hypothetical protein
MTDSNTKIVYAEYTGISQFEIPSDVKEYSIIWDKLTYKDKEGKEVEQEPQMSVEEDIELCKRPKDTWESTEDLDTVPESFFEYFEDMDKEEIVELLWSHMKVKNRKEILNFMMKKK